MVAETAERTEQAEADAQAFTLGADVFIAAVDQCLVAVARDDSRPVLTGVHVKVTSTAVEFASADGFQLVIVNVPVKRAGDDWSAIIDAKALKDALATVKAADKATPRYASERTPVTITLAENRQSVTLAAGTSTAVLPVIQGTFPDYQALVPVGKPELEGNKVAFNGNMVGALLAKAGKYAPLGIVRMRIQQPSQPMRFDWQSPEQWTATAVVMPMFVTW